MKFTRMLTVLAFALAPTLAHAHPGHVGHEGGGIGWGFAHPFTGLDHLLAMIAVGLWAVQLGGRALLALPAAFVGAMTLGGVLGMSGVGLPFVEPMILASALVLGALMAAGARLSLGWSAGIVALSALFHGQAHGAEMPAGANGWLTAFGFVAATALLHATGVFGGLGLQRLAQSRALRLAGVAIFALAALLGAGLI
jgi:urease accessory protein